MRYGLMSRKFSKIEAKTDNPDEKKQAREERIKYFTLMVYEDADATLLRLFECFMESAPQLILQVKSKLDRYLARGWYKLFNPKFKIRFFTLFKESLGCK